MKNKSIHILTFLLGTILSSINMYAQQPCFTVSPARGCAPLTVTVTECTNGGQTIQYWYGELPKKYTIETQYTYMNAGNYTITQIMDQVGSQNNSTTRPVEALSSVDPVYQIDYCTDFKVKLTIKDNVYDSFAVQWGDGKNDTLTPGQSRIHTYTSATPASFSVKGQYNPSKCGKQVSQTVNPVKSLMTPVIASVMAISGGGIEADISSASKGTASFLQFRSDNLTLNAQKDTLSPLSFMRWPQAATDNLYHYRLDYASACADVYSSNVVAVPHLKITTTLKDITVSWQPVNIPGHFFELYRNGQKVYTGTEAIYPDKNVVCGVKYKYYLKTIFPDAYTQSLADSVFFTSTNTPEAVVNLSAGFDTDNNLKVSWDKTVSPVKGGYQVEILKGGTVSKTVNSPKESIVFKSGEIEQPACFDIFFSDSCQNVSKTSQIVCPVILQGSELANQVSLGWTGYAANGNTSYEYEIILFDGAGNVLLTKDAGSSLSSSFADIDTTIQIKRYRIKVKSDDIYSNTITIETPSTLFLPNAFSPNGDGINDTFHAKGHYIKTFRMAVYSSSGQLINVSEGMGNGWDGNMNGQPAPMAMYNYVVEATDQLGKAMNRKGAVTLIR